MLDLRFMLDFLLYMEPGVAGLPDENSEFASPSNEGMESLEFDRSYEDLSPDWREHDLASSASSAFSNSMLNGLLS
jgi:hypothetical protein